jgi:hypothetical protein
MKKFVVETIIEELNKILHKYKINAFETTVLTDYEILFKKVIDKIISLVTINKEIILFENNKYENNFLNFLKLL